MGGKKQNVTSSFFTLYARQRTWARALSKLGSIHSGCRLSWALIAIMPLPLCFALDLIAICNNGGVCEAHMCLECE
jgi:hypothetical protein